LQEPVTAITTTPAAEAPATGITTELPAAALPPRRFSNRVVLGVILTVMAGMATAALVFALNTQGFRRANDRGITQKQWWRPPAAVEPLPPGGQPVATPAQLEALGYLPRDVDLIITVQTEQLLSAPIAPALFQEGLRIGRMELHAERIARVTGQELQDLDHLVVGVHLDDAFPPHLWIIGRTKKPYDADRLRKKLEAQRVADTGSRIIHRFVARQMPIPLNLFCPDDRTIVVSLLPGDLKAIPDTRNEKLDQLNSELVDLIRKRCDVAPVWLAAHVEKWDSVLSRPLLADYSKELRRLLTEIDTAGVSLHLDRAMMLRAAIHCKEAGGARALDSFFQAHRTGGEPSLKTQQEDAWLSVQMPTDLDGLRKSLSPAPR
jgi:hypothetical protein